MLRLEHNHMMILFSFALCFLSKNLFQLFNFDLLKFRTTMLIYYLVDTLYVLGLRAKRQKIIFSEKVIGKFVSKISSSRLEISSSTRFTSRRWFLIGWQQPPIFRLLSCLKFSTVQTFFRIDYKLKSNNFTMLR